MAVSAPQLVRVDVWTIGGSAVPTVITQGLSFPCPAVAFASDGTLFVANGGNDTVTAYAPPYTGAPLVISVGIKGPVSLAVDAGNDLIVANNSNHNVTIYPPPYTTAAPTTLSDIGPTQASAVLDAGNHLWVVASTPYLLRYSAPYTPGAFDVAIGGVPSTLGTPSALAVDAAGRPYVADSNKIVRFDPPFSNAGPALTISSTASQPITSPSALAVAPDGTIFVANTNTSGPAFYSPTGTPLGVTIGFYNVNVTLGANAFAADADGTMWLARNQPGFPTPYGPANFTSLTPYSAAGDAIAIYP